MEALQAGRKIGCYELIRLLGEGGMGEVWLAHDEPADRSVALKFIKPHLLNTPGMRTRFTNEARTLGKLEQDRIVTLYTVVEEGEYLAFVLRFIEGESLADRIDNHYPLPMSFILSSSRDILAALGEAHQRGIIHRDIKPQNILIDGRDRSFLTDFGIAVTDFLERATVGAFAIGTPHYMSPEQITKPRDITIAKGGQRTDIYSYGVVLYEMLTGRVPFGQDSSPEEVYTIQQAHCQDEPPRLRLINDTISPAMEEVVLHCLEKNPDDRPQSCAALLEEIESAAAAGMAVVRSTRARTVIEEVVRPPVMTDAQRPSGLQSTTEPFTGGAKKRSAGQRNLVLAGVSTLLAAGLVATIYTVTNKHTTETAPSTTAAPSETSTGTPPKTGGAAAPGGTRVVVPVGGRPNQTGQTGAPPSSQVPGGANPAHVNQAPVNQAPAAAPGPSRDVQEAAGLASQADKEFTAGAYCDALSKLNEAIALNRDPKYLRLQPSYKHGCDSQ